MTETDKNQTGRTDRQGEKETVTRTRAEKEIEAPSEWKVRTRSQLDSWASAVAVLLVVVALVGGWMTYTAFAVEDEPEFEEVVTGEWRTAPSFSHSATVERQNPLYEVGDTVDGGLVYYTDVTPSLDGVYSFRYTATDDGSLDVETEVEMVLQETDGGGGVYWSQTEELVETSETDVPPGQRVSTEFTVDVPSVERRIDDIQSGLGTSVGSEEAVIHITTRVDGEVNGEDVNFGERHRVYVEIGSDTYTVEMGDEGMQGNSFENTETVEAEEEENSLNMVFSPVVLLLSLGLLFGLVAAKRKDRLAPTERELLALERHEFDEWISTGKVSDDVFREGGRSVVYVDSIEGVVDVAIDVGGRVIEDRDRSVLAVIDDDVVYVYEYEQDVWGSVEKTEPEATETKEKTESAVEQTETVSKETEASEETRTSETPDTVTTIEHGDDVTTEHEDGAETEDASEEADDAEDEERDDVKNLFEKLKGDD